MSQETNCSPGIYVTVNFEDNGRKKRAKPTPKIVLGTIYEIALHELVLASYYHTHISGSVSLGQRYRKMLIDYGYKLPPHNQLEKGNCWEMFLELNQEHVVTTPPMYPIVKK